VREEFHNLDLKFTDQAAQNATDRDHQRLVS
jgi:hypothetical protein